MRPVSAVSDEIIRDLRFQRNVKALHSLGPRAVGEFLAEVGADRSIQTLIEQKLQRYAELTPEQVEAVSAGDWASFPLRAVGEPE